MKRLLIALAFLLPLPAHAQQTKAALTTEINTNFATGVPGGITAATLRTTSLDILNSIMPTAPVVNNNSACFDGVTGLLKDCGIAPTASGLTVGISAIASGTTTRVLFDNAGILGEYAISGTGNVCMTTSCSMTTPALGTPSAVVLTSGTGLPISTGVSGLGTGVATALGVNVGTAGAFVTFNGALGTPASGVGTNLTGTAAGLTAGTVTTNANLTGPVTSVGNATAVTNNAITRGMEAQGIARSVIGVTGNVTANVADIQGTADQALVVNSAGTALAFGKVNLTAGAGATGTLPVANGGTGDTGTAWTAFTPTVTCGTATFTTTSARSKTQGKITFAELDATFTAIGTCTNLLTFNLPNTAQSGGSLNGRENTISGKGVNCSIVAAGTIASCSLADATNFANAERLLISGVYENQ